jgi:excisionase family DNA binding protein
MSNLISTEANNFMSVHQASDYLQLNEKKIYALVKEGKIPATKITGKWMFPRELVKQWMMDSAHGGLLTDRLILSGNDDPLLYRVIMDLAEDNGTHALISHTPTSTQLGLGLLQANRIDACSIHWGRSSDSKTKHPALIRQYSHHHNWIFVRAFQREQGLMLSPQVASHTMNQEDLFDTQFRWAIRQSGTGTKQFLTEMLSQYQLSSSDLNTTLTALSEREAASAIVMGKADVAPGRRSSAQEFGLAFVPIGWEAFDLVLRREIWFRRLFQNLITRLKSAPCQKIAADLGGYDFSECGTLVWGDN